MATAAHHEIFFNPKCSHSDRERWVCFYPTYINSKRTVAQGRRLPKSICVENPSYTEIRDICSTLGLPMGVESKVHPRELDHRDQKNIGRIRVQIKNNDGTPIKDDFKCRKDLFKHVAAKIPQLKSRTSSAAQAQSNQGQSKKAKSKKR